LPGTRIALAKDVDAQRRSKDFATARERMVRVQLAWRGIHDAALLQAMNEVPREAFVEEAFRDAAYDDGPLPIGEGQTISQPYIVALMIEAAEISKDDQALEVGAGSGYAAAVMSRLAREVYAIERHLPLVEEARHRFQELGYDNIHLRAGDGTRGWPEAAPFNAILVSASGPEVPKTLKEQLAIGGRLVVPVGHQAWRQTLCKITRVGEDRYDQQQLGAVAFVPLIGEQGWADDDRGPTTNDSHTAGRP
jgi:protein-L-isoaspartate(D-aspartate) O-methyltransferase